MIQSAFVERGNRYHKASGAFFEALREQQARSIPDPDLTRVAEAIRLVDALCDALEKLNLRAVPLVPKTIGTRLQSLDEELPIDLIGVGRKLRTGAPCIDALEVLYDLQQALLDEKDRVLLRLHSEQGTAHA